MNHKLFLIEDLEACPYLHKPGTELVVGGEKLTVCAWEEGETRRWTRTDTLIVRDSETRHWAIPYEANPSDHDAGAEGFKDHATDHGNREYVKAWEVHPKPVQTIIWEAVK